MHYYWKKKIPQVQSIYLQGKAHQTTLHMEFLTNKRKIWCHAKFSSVSWMRYSVLVWYQAKKKNLCPFKKIFYIIFIISLRIDILEIAPVNTKPEVVLNYTCSCYPPNTTHVNFNETANVTMETFSPFLTSCADFGDNETSEETFFVLTSVKELVHHYTTCSSSSSSAFQ